MSFFEVMGGSQSSNKYKYLGVGCLFSGMQAFSRLWKAPRANKYVYLRFVCFCLRYASGWIGKGKVSPKGIMGMIPLKVLNVTSRRSRKPPAGNPDSLIYDTRGALDPPGASP